MQTKEKERVGREIHADGRMKEKEPWRRREKERKGKNAFVNLREKFHSAPERKQSSQSWITIPN